MVSEEELVKKAEVISAVRDYESRRVRRRERKVDFTVSPSGSDDKILIRVITGSKSRSGYVGVDTVKEMSEVLKKRKYDKGILIGKQFAKAAESEMEHEKRIGYVSTYPPRECGIANYTRDLIDAVDGLHEFRPSVVIAINEKGAIYKYGRRVRFQIERDSIDDYIQAVRYANLSKVNLVNLQHEFGLFGGEWGEYINSFLEDLQKPVVTTLHTIVPNFGSAARTVLESITYYSASIVVMTRTALQLLKNCNIKREKIDVIPHGCPDVPFVASERPKTSLGLRGRIVLSTFGLINRGKGIQYAIRALSSLVKKEPRILYLIIGETHPEVRKIEGERYRKRLMRLVDELGLGKHVRFYNRFLSKRELVGYLQATDIYITPYVDRNQISSGTLVYALGTGKAIISTPFLHAEEALADGRGLKCKFRKPASIARCINKLLEDPELRFSLERKAYAYSRDFTWPKVAEKYVKLFNRVLKD